MADADNLVFGKYRVIRRIAVGGMGEIFLGRQTGVAGFDRLVILKTMLPDLAEEEGFLEQFLDEARVAATLNHPNIVSIYEVGQWQGVYIIAMEYIKGDHLGRLIQSSIKAKQPIPCEVAAQVAHDAALALDHAHFAVDTEGKPLRIVHRDIGLQNVMVRLDGVTKVVDFGVARAANRASRTRTGLVKGKLPYMSPEQAAGAQLDGRSDQFSLGVVLWELTTRRRLFKADNDLITLRKLIHEPIPPPSSMVPGYPVALEMIVMRMLERDREKRFARCADVATALRAYLDSSGQLVNEKVVSAYVREVLAEKIEEDLHDLTPTKESPFASVIGIGGATPTGQRAGPPGEGSGEVAAVPARRKGLQLALAVGLGGLAALALPLAWRALQPADEPAVATSVPASQPGPAVEPAVAVGPASQPSARLVLSSDPVGAAVLIDGAPRGETPLTLEGIEPGRGLRIQLERAGFEPITTELALQAGETRALTLPMFRSRSKIVGKKPPRTQPTTKVATPAPAAEGKGYLSVRTTPWTKVIVDGKPYGSTPLYKEALPAGRHTVLLVNEVEGISATRKITIQPGQTEKLDLNLGK